MKAKDPQPYKMEESYVSQLLKAWPRAHAFFSALQSIWTAERGTEAASTALVELHKNHEKDIVTRFKRLPEEKDVDFRSLKHVFANALPKLKTTPATFLETLQALQRASEGDGAGGLIMSDIQEMCEVQPAFAVDLIKHLQRHPKRGAQFLPAALVGLSGTNFERAYDDAKGLLSEKPDSLRNAAIGSLGSLKYEGRSKQIGEAHALLKGVATNHEDPGNVNAELALGCLLKNDPTLIGKTLAVLAKAGSEGVRMRIPYALYGQTKYSGEEWFRDSLLNLHNLPGTNLPEGNWLDALLADLSRQGNHDLCTQFMNGWLCNHPECLPSPVFDHFIQALTSSQKDVVGELVPVWLAERTPAYWLFAEKVMGEYALQRERDEDNRLWEFRYSKDAFNQLSVEDMHFLIRKTIGYAFLHPQFLCAAVFSCLNRSRDRSDIADLVKTYFVRLIGYHYYGGAKNFLHMKKKRGTQRQKRIAGDILTQLTTYFDNLSSLPSLPERNPPADRWVAYQKATNARNQQATKKAEESSIVSQIASRLPLKYRCRYISRYVAGPDSGHTILSEVSSLCEIGVSRELPRGCTIDPVGIEYFLAVFRSETEVITLT